MNRFAFLLMALLPSLAMAQTREQKVRADRQKVESEGFWIYNDLVKGFAEAKRTGKPLLVVLRCVPCVECVKLDDDLVDRDPVIRPLLEKFVCVRQVSTNGLDLATFQYDTDQLFAVFMLNADGAIYGRFGTRSHRTEWLEDVSLPGMALALQGALKLHANYPNNQRQLAGKRGPAPEFSSPEKYPALKDKYTATLNYSGNVVQSCIHCHQIGDAQRTYYRAQGEPIPESVLFPYPHPKTIGLTLAPRQQATVSGVAPDSAAAAAGLRAGDNLLSLNDQPLLSIADVQWVLHTTPPSGGHLAAVIEWDGRTQTLSISLTNLWRRSGDLSWRSSSWGMRAMAAGGLLLDALPTDERAAKGMPAQGMALLVKHVGQFGNHAAAKNAGFQNGDVIVKYDGRTDLLRETDLLRHGLQQHKVGDRIAVTVMRDGKSIELTLPMQP